MKQQTVVLSDVYNDQGDMVRIEAVDADTGKPYLDFLLDPRDEQTPENRVEFRRWAGQILTSKQVKIAGDK